MKAHILVVLTLLLAPIAHAQLVYQSPPAPLDRLIDAPLTPSALLSPDATLMVWQHRSSLPSIAEVAAPEVRLAGMRISPRTNGPSRSSTYTGLSIKPVHGGLEQSVHGVPENSGIRSVQFSPDGSHIAFLVESATRIDLYVADIATGSARPLTELAINETQFGAYSWHPDSKSLLVRVIPADRPAMPERPLAPAGPVVQDNLGTEAPARTYQDLLTNPYDEHLFAWFVTSQIMNVGLDGSVTAIGPQGLAARATPSPDGRYVLLRMMHRPFSYLVPSSRFAHSYAVYDMAGDLVKEVARLPVADNVPTAFGSTTTGPRSIGWRADAPATLVWAEALDGGDARKTVDLRDEVWTWAAPFDQDPESLIKLELRYGGISWGHDELALVSENWWSTRQTRTWVLNPSDPGVPARLLFDRSTEDRYGNPGSFNMTRNEQGRSVLRMRDGKLLLSGAGASEEGDRPFLRSLDLETGATETLFRSEAPYYERPVMLLDDQRLLTLRESTDEVPNYYLRDLASGELTAVSQFEHPYPELAGVSKMELSYVREDGVPLDATLYLPPGYDKDRDGPLPGLVWAYPREFKSAALAGQRSGSPYRFKSISYSGAVPYVTQGYAVIDGAAMPVIGEGEAEPNDTFRSQLVANAQAVIEEGVRLGVLDPSRVAIAGHSYGAFMTANLLAHSDLFRAGIARSGAYNRTLTPFGFQREERLFWESPETYYTMSPFMHAHKVNEPILLIHGEADNNSGTFPLQSRRFYHALKGLGKTARLVMLPHESHGYRARESVMHVLWETTRWLDNYVKNPDPVPKLSEPIGAGM